MRWRTGRRSSNIEDRRGQTSRGTIFGGGRRLRVSRRAGKGGIGIVVIALVALYFGIDPAIILQGGMPMQPEPRQQSAPRDAAQDQLADFVSVVLADTEDSWKSLFSRMGRSYEEPTLVLFTDRVGSACGMGSAAMGPFYCPGDQQIYIDLGFYRDLRERHGAPGDFAQAYVIAHEVGHHVQTLLGISPKVRAAQRGTSQAQANELSVRQELQADCFAGVWAHHADRVRGILEQGDVEEALRAASSIGDDRLQRQARGEVTPESFTHGSSVQRMRWFKRGIESGEPSRCDTFKVRDL